MLVLAVNFVLPFVGYLIGAGLVLASKAWDARDKAIALLIAPFVVVVGALLVLGGAAASVAATVLMATALSGLPGAAYLSHRLRRPRAG